MATIPSLQTMKDEALAKLSGQWGNAVVTYLVMVIMLMIPFVSWIITGPLQLGIDGVFLKLTRGEKMDINDLFDGFKNFGNALVFYILSTLLIVIGLVFLIIPGIILALGLSQSYRILKDNPEMNAIDAMQKSFEIMRGNKGDYFILLLSFIGWAILCIFTLGIGFLFLAPYMNTTSGIFYNYITDYQDSDLKELASEIS